MLGPPNDMPWGQRVAHIQDPDGNTVNLTDPSRGLVRGLSPAIHAPFGRNIRGGLPLGLSKRLRCQHVTACRCLSISAVPIPRKRICSGQTSGAAESSHMWHFVHINSNK